SQVIRLDVGSDGETLAVGSRDGWISLWKLGETTPWFMQRAHAGSVTTLQFSPDGHWLISASEADTLRVWDVKDGTLVHSLPITRGVDSAAFSADGNQLYVVVERPSKAAPYRSVLTRWRFDARSGLQPDDGWSEFEVMSILASGPDGSLLLGNVALYNAYHSSLWNPDESQMAGDLVESPDARSYVFSPDGHWLAVAVGKQGVHLRDTQDTFWNGPILAGHRAGVGAVAFTPDGQVLASGDWSGNIQLLRVAGGRRLLRELRGHQDTVRGLAFTPDGRKLISGGDDNTIRVWDIAGIVPTSGRRPTPVAPVLPVSPEQAWRVTTPMSAWGFRRLYPDIEFGVHVADAYGDTLIAAGGRMYHHRLDADEREWGEIESKTWIVPWALAMVSEDEFWAAGMSGKLRHFRGSMWEEVTGPTQDHLWDIEMLAPDDGWIVGENGAVWRYQGAEWLTVATPTTDTLYALDFVSPDEAWAAGRDGTLLHFESGAWQRVPSPTTEHLRGLDMVSRDLGWAVGAGGTILRFDGQKWLSVQSPITDNLHCVSAPAPGVAWAVGMDGAMLYFDGEAWRAGRRFTSDDMWSVLMLSPEEGWAFSGHSFRVTVLHYVSGEWRRVSSPMPALYAADAVGSTGWALGDARMFDREEPMAMQYIDGDWRVSPGVDAGVDVKALDMVSQDDAWAVGGNRIYHWSLDSSEVMTVPCRLADIEMLSADAGWTVGHGCAFRYQAGIWHSVPISKEWHFGVLGLVSEDDGWASGWVHRDPRLFRLQAGTWIALDIPSEEAFGVIVMVSADEGWAGGGTLSEGQLYHFQGGQWQRESIPRTHCEFVDIEMLSSTEGWALNDCGEVYHYEDEQWRLVAQLDDRVQDLIRLQNGELWVLGDYGAFWFRGP
ncbi:MAG: hypothetical protein GF364_22570, partial [Candidatus Lokiarchaeota archaeon]|nr:hypothetical protein [Candidatus Lokiarchaeota archaeon]